jgi:hypothetical protein
MTDQTRVAIGKDTQLPQVLVDLQSYFEFSFEMDELLRRLESASTGGLSTGGLSTGGSSAGGSSAGGSSAGGKTCYRDETWEMAQWELHRPLPGRCARATARNLGLRGERL